jgi:hypothetical protein
MPAAASWTTREGPRTRRIAAVAVCFGAVVLHYDSDFDHIAEAYPQFVARWIVTRGSVD